MSQEQIPGGTEELRAELATLKNDANGKVARGPKGRFVSVKG